MISIYPTQISHFLSAYPSTIQEHDFSLSQPSSVTDPNFPKKSHRCPRHPPAPRYAVYHRKEGLQKIAQRVHGLAQLYASEAQKAGLNVTSTQAFFDTAPGRCAVDVWFLGSISLLEETNKHHFPSENRFSLLGSGDLEGVGLPSID